MVALWQFKQYCVEWQCNDTIGQTFIFLAPFVRHVVKQPADADLQNKDIVR